MPLRAGFYIDGFNFYHAIHDLGRNHLKWMSYRDLAGLLRNSDEAIEHIKMFSAYATFKPQSTVRHRQFTAAQESLGVECIMGVFKEKRQRCNRCKSSWKGHEEKETDVNMALHLLADCLDNSLDVAYLITTDSDLAPAARMVKKLGCPIDLVTVSTPGRTHSYELRDVCHRKAKVTVPMVEACLMPQHLCDAQGNVIATRPIEYDPPKGSP